MEKGEPAFKPEWLKSSNGSTSSNASSNHLTGTSSHSNEHGAGISSRNRLPAAVGDRDRGLLSSARRSSSLNGKSRAYSSFGRSNRDREREKDLDLLDRESRSVLLDNGYNDRFDSLIASRSEKDSLRRGTMSNASFEKDFPSLGAEEKNGRLDVGRVSSPGISTPLQSIPLSVTAISGINSWNSVLAEVPKMVGSNGPQSAPTNQVPSTPSTSTGLNMAETVAQAPSRSRNAPQLSVETQRIEELTIRQCKQLIPVTPSTTKSLVSSSSDKLKNKGARVGDSTAALKAGQQLSSQPVSAVPRASVKADTVKLPQGGSFQVLNREKNGISPTAKEGSSVGKPVSPIGVHPSASVLSLKSPTNQKPRVEGKASALPSPQGPFGEKRSQAKDRHEFFNFIRNKTSNSSGAVPEAGGVSSSSSLVNSGKQSDFSGDNGKDADSVNFKCVENGDCSSEVADGSEQSECLLPDNEDAEPCLEPVDPEEEAFLRSLGWDQNAVVDALTKEEIDAFNMKYKERKKPSQPSENISPGVEVPAEQSAAM
uniref:Uncharacterized protein n=1 Tax=Ananas comosus var. bracteatus TaxID=296719 RepID=A0A6V7P8A6_ANACO|nr:unnamed protein product [Ananas comosus var. bracteatus]